MPVGAITLPKAAQNWTRVHGWWVGDDISPSLTGTHPSKLNVTLIQRPESGLVRNSGLELPDDPLLRLAGCITSDVGDAADRHDYYIGKAIYDEMHQDEMHQDD